MWTAANIIHSQVHAFGAQKRTPEISQNCCDLTQVTRDLRGAAHDLESDGQAILAVSCVSLRLNWCVTRLQASLNCVVNLSPMDRYLSWRLNAKPYLVTADLHHNDLYVVVDDDTFVFLS